MISFNDLGLSPSILKGVDALGFSTPTPIQAEIIPKILSKSCDVVGLAQTGTGKTAAFGLPVLDLIDTDSNDVQALILSPTRELSVQIFNELSLFGKFLKGLKMTAVYGGADIVGQMKDLRRGTQIVVATPGRLRDLINRGAIHLNSVKYVILDEADEMLNMGFKEELDEILTQIPKERNTWLFSATMPDEVKRISREYMNNPVEVRIGSKDEVNKDIDHQYVLTHRAIKYDVLRRFLDYSSDTFCLVFCRTRMDARDLAEALVKDGYDADALHGDLNQSQRDRVMARFKNQHLKVLVATDVAARGIDVQDITHVFHYNIPDDFSFYTHRSGRTGRAGSKGVSLILAHPKEEQMIRTLSNKLKIDITKAHIPTGKEICERRLMAYMNSVRDAEINEEAKSFMPKVVEAMSILSKEEIIEKVAALTFNGFLQLYQDAPDLNMNSKRKEDRAAGGTGGDMKRLFINIGSLDMDGKGLLINLVCSQSKISGSMIGRIDFRQGYSFFDVDASVAERVIQSFENENFNGRPLRVNIDEGATETKGKKDRHRNQPKFEGKEDAKPRFDAAKKDSYRRKKTKR